MNFKRLIYNISIVLLIIVVTKYVGETYSQFKTDSSGSGDTQIAKWAVALKDGFGYLDNKFDIAISSTSDNNGNTAPNRLAPGNSARATLMIDLTGTEVSVDYNITIDKNEILKAIGNVPISVNMYDSNDKEIEFGQDIYVPLVNQEAFTSDNGIFTFYFDINWTNVDGISDTYDTNLALNFDDLKIPVYVKIKQHLEDANYEEERKKITTNISYLETTETVKRETEGLNYKFPTQDALHNNPERGFYSSSTIGLNENGLVLPSGYFSAVTKSNTSNLLHLKVDLSAFSGNMNSSKKDIELTSKAILALENVLESIKQNNNTILLRFVYDNNATGVITENGQEKTKIEPAQTMLLRHIEQLGPTLKKYKKTINVVQIGFYGLWGETYYNTDVNSHPEYYKQTTEALLKATEGTNINIALRTPSYYASYRGIDIENIESDLTTSSESAYRVGVFNDGYGGSSDDLGTYAYNREKETNWLHNQASHTFYGGEAIVDSGYNPSNPSSAIGAYNTSKYFIKEAFKIHTSYINWEWNQALHQEWAKQTYTSDIGDDTYYYGTPSLLYIESHLGYRFVVKEVRTYKTATSQSKLPIDITIENVGFGNLIREKQADIIITNSSGNIVHTETNVDFNALDFLSQTAVKKTININLPTLASGEYNVYLRLSNGEKLNSGKYYGAIQFANSTSYYNESLEANYIAKFNVE